MTVPRDHAYERSYFLVDLGAGDEPRPFHTVDLPVATTDVVTTRSGNAKLPEPERRPGLVTYTNLVLTRGLRGETDLSEWWDQVRAGVDDVRRRVNVQLLDERREPVWTWSFTEAFPAAYRFSQLDADSSDVVDEIIELAFTRMSIA